MISYAATNPPAKAGYKAFPGILVLSAHAGRMHRMPNPDVIEPDDV